jgi:hypothetical protein
MAPDSACDYQRGRRILAAVISIAALLAALSTLMSGATPARAASGSQGNASPVKSSNPPSPSPTTTRSPAPTPSCSFRFNPDFCPSPTPSVVVVSPVAPDPSPSLSTPSYLIGIAPSPSPSRDGTSTVSSPVPLGGGFVDQQPTPSQQASVAPSADLAPHQSGLPLAFLAVGALLVMGAAGSLLYAIAPREKKVFVRERAAPSASPVYFTPYGPDAAGTNLPGPQEPA